MSIKSICFTALLMVTTALHAQPKVSFVSETGFIVENQVEITQPPGKVWQALVKDVDKWWPKDHTWWGTQSTLSIDPIAGGCFCEKVADKSAEHMRIAFVDPGKMLRMTGGLGPLQGMGMHGALDWSFSETDKGTTITLTYKVTGINPDGFEKLAPIVAQVQGMQLQGLADYLVK